MKITIAGPGAGKTTNLASEVCESRKQSRDPKWIFVVTYTNNAVNVIKNKLDSSPSSTTERISVSTIHSFLLSEIIFPFHHFLFNQKYLRATSKDIPNDPIEKAIICKKLHEKGVIHNSEVFECAKFVLCGKTNEKKETKLLRRKIIANIQSYISDIFVDEAQDIDDNLCSVLQVFFESGIKINLIGDPKQNIKACKGFYSLMATYGFDVLEENYRSPGNHVSLLNKFAPSSEKQVSCSPVVGDLDFIMGNRVLPEVVTKNDWDLIYIYSKSNEFITKSRASRFEFFFETIFDIVSDLSIEEPEKICYKILKKTAFEPTFDASNCIKSLKKNFSTSLSYSQEKQLSDAFDNFRQIPPSSCIYANTIDSIKGCEGERCLFILTNALAPYLLEPTCNRNMPNAKLFVALSRARQNLTIYIHNSVIIKEKKKDLPSIFQSFGFTDKTNSYI